MMNVTHKEKNKQTKKKTERQTQPLTKERSQLPVFNEFIRFLKKTQILANFGVRTGI